MRSIHKVLLLFTLLYMTTPTETDAKSKNKETVVEITTSIGKIKVKLYNETPLHRDNFIKLAKEGFYDDILFHRVIKDFMIQAGDPNSRNAEKGKSLGEGGPGHTIPAEFVYPQLFHKRGALSAARTGDQVNPKKESSGSQFYIVWGTTYTNGKLDTMEQQFSSRIEQNIFNRLAASHRDSIMEYRRTRNQQALTELQEQLIAQTKTEAAQTGKFKFTEEQRKTYTTVGGTPHLDGEYTVFGEVIDGLEIVEKIQKCTTDGNDRPTEDIKILKTKVK